jgi:SAM-dependent methyltransferase
MRESGIRARGVDLDLDMILLCREKGLDVSAQDAFAYLRALPDDSLGGIFAAQVIEHLHPLRVIELVNLCHRKLGPGGVLIVETPNPKCLMVFADTFYKDPSHVQPAHPDTMQFLFEALNFHQVELRFLGPVDPFMRIPSLQAPGADFARFNEGIDRLNTLLFGFQEYAVIGQKSLARPTREPAFQRSASRKGHREAAPAAERHPADRRGRDRILPASRERTYRRDRPRAALGGVDRCRARPPESIPRHDSPTHKPDPATSRWPSTSRGGSPGTPHRHYAHFSKRLKARPLASTPVEVQYDWLTERGFVVGDVRSPADDLWRGRPRSLHPLLGECASCSIRAGIAWSSSPCTRN